jgi:hypothetical protein
MAEPVPEKQLWLLVNRFPQPETQQLDWLDNVTASDISTVFQ